MAKGKPKAVPHWVVYNAKGEPVKCVNTGKAAVKAKVEMERLEGYSLKQMDKSVCPLCFPKPAQEENGQDRETVTLPDAKEVRPGMCHNGCESRAGQFKLKFHSHVLIRICKDCGGVLDLNTSKPWEG